MKGNDKTIRLVSFCPCGEQMDIVGTRAGFVFYKCVCGRERKVKNGRIIQERGNDYTKI